MNRFNRDRNAAVVSAILMLGLAGCQAKSDAEPPSNKPL